MYTNLPTFVGRETGQGYTEYTSKRPMALDDPMVIYDLEEEFQTEPDMIDVRDPYTVWIWEN